MQRVSNSSVAKHKMDEPYESFTLKLAEKVTQKQNVSKVKMQREHCNSKRRNRRRGNTCTLLRIKGGLVPSTPKSIPAYQK